MTMLNARKISLLACIAYASNNLQYAKAFVPSSKITYSPSSSSIHMARHHDDGVVTDQASRREIMTTFVSVAGATLGMNPNVAMAAGPPTDAELARIKVGYEGILYLLDNWEKETTVCRDNGGECKRNAEPVRRYLGLRSTTDPLFQAEKIFGKIKYMDVDPDDLETIFEASEDWNAAVTMSNSMAFISQFGEYNPGGGKEEVKKYLDESEKQVIMAKTALEKIMIGLKI